jgi:dimethylargininase
MQFSRGLVRPPGASFSAGLTNCTEGPPDLPTALEQHRSYCDALRRCGLDLTALAAEPAFPDGTFVEDTAVLIPGLAIITRPGAPSRRGETPGVEAALCPFFDRLQTIVEPGTVDGGDVCAAGDQFFIGLSARTNESGARELARILKGAGYGSTLVDIRASKSLLHLKSGITYLGGGLLVLSSDAPRVEEFRRYELLTLSPGEDYAANCLAINGRILIAAGYPEFADALRRRGREVIALNMSEFRKMDGGLTCLSLRF